MARRSLGTLSLDLILQMGGFEEGMSQADRSTKKMQDRIEAAGRAFDRMVKRIDPVLKKEMELKALHEELNAALSAGMIDQQDYAHYKKLLDQQAQALKNSTAEAKAEAQAQAELDRAMQAASTSRYEFIEGLREQIKTMGMSEEELLRFRARLAGAEKAAEPLIQQLINQKKALNDSAEASRNAATAEREYEKTLEALKAQLDPVGTGLAKIASQQKALDTALSRGSLTTEQYNQLSAALAKVRKEIDGTAEAARKAKQAEAEEANALAMLRRQYDPLGHQIQQVIRQQALLDEQFHKRNIGETEHRRLMANLKAEEEELERLRRAAGQSNGGISNHQKQFADRWLPSQLHDVASSMAAGMPLTTVLTQQGTQIKDLYGTAGEAIKGVGRYVVSLINPMMVAGAAAAGIAYSVYKIALAFAETKSQILLAGRSYQEFKALQSTMIDVHASVRGASFSDTNQAVALAASNAGIAYADIGHAATVAVEAEHFLDKSIESTIKEYGALRTAGVDSIVALNDQYGFLTVSQYEHIRSLQDTGHAIEAGTTAQQLYIDKMKEVASEAEKTLPPLKRMWLEIQGVMSDFGDTGAVIMGYGSGMQQAQMMRQQAEANLLQLQRDKDSWGNKVGLSTYTDENYKKALADYNRWNDVIKKGLDAQKEAAKLDNDSKIKVNNKKTVDDLLYSNLSNDNRVAAERTKLANQLKEAGASQEQIAKALSGYDANHKKADKAASTAGESMLSQVKQSGVVLQEQLKALQENAGNLSEAEKAIAKFDTRLSEIRRNGTKSGADKDMVRNAEAIRAELQKNAILEKQVKNQEDFNKLQKDAKDIADAMTTSLNNQLQANEDQALGFGSSDRAKEHIKSLHDIDKEYAKYRQQTMKAIPQGQENSPVAQDALAEVDKQKQARIEALKAGWDAEAQARGDWQNGMTQSWGNYLEKAQDVAASTKSAFDAAFGGMEDALVTFVKTGKLSFSSLVDSIIDGLARIAVQQAVLGLANMFGSAFAGPSISSGGAGGAAAVTGNSDISNFVLHKATGGYISGPGTSTSDSIPAMLSDGEFVVNAAAVAQPGVRDTLEALNARRRYATGGYVASSGYAGSTAANAFAPQKQSGVVIENVTVEVTAQQGISDQDAQRQGQQIAAGMIKKIAQDVVASETMRTGGVIFNALRQK